MAPFRNDTAKKRAVREQVLDFVLATYPQDKAVTALTLPADNYKFELKLLKARPNSVITCCEWDKELYEKQVLRFKDQKTKWSYHCNDIFKLVDNQDVVYLDLCGALIDRTCLQLEDAFKNKMRDTKVILVTYCDRRDNVDRLCKLFGLNNTKENRRLIRYELYPQYLGTLLGREFTMTSINYPASSVGRGLWMINIIYQVY